MNREGYSERIEQAYLRRLAANKRRIDSIKAQRKCLVCLQPLPEGRNRVWCEACSAKYNIAQKERYRYYISIGVCPKCKKNKLAAGIRLCRSCAVKRSMYVQKRQEKLVAAGKCSRCGAALDGSSGLLCEACRTKRKAYSAEYRLNKQKGEKR